MKNEITKYLQGYIDRMEAKGITPTMDDLNRKAAEFTHIQNNAPRTCFEGYSSVRVSGMTSCLVCTDGLAL